MACCTGKLDKSTANACTELLPELWQLDNEPAANIRTMAKKR